MARGHTERQSDPGRLLPRGTPSGPGGSPPRPRASLHPLLGWSVFCSSSEGPGLPHTCSWRDAFRPLCQPRSSCDRRSSESGRRLPFRRRPRRKHLRAPRKHPSWEGPQRSKAGRAGRPCARASPRGQEWSASPEAHTPLRTGQCLRGTGRPSGEAEAGCCYQSSPRTISRSCREEGVRTAQFPLLDVDSKLFPFACAARGVQGSLPQGLRAFPPAQSTLSRG